MACTQKPESADLVLLNGDIWTVDEAIPTAKALVVRDNAITAVCQSDAKAERYIGDETKVIDLEGQFVTPGIIDGHVHFNRAGGLILDANLMTVSDEDGLCKEIGRVVGILDDGEWITRGLWGAYEQWALGDAGVEGSEKAEPWRPNRSMIDDLTPNNPCFLCRFDYKEWLANTAALKAAELEGGKVKGMILDKDGKSTGVVLRPSPAFDKMQVTLAEHPKSQNRLLNENRAALKALRESGIVEIHDIARPDQTKRFVELQENGELTCRVWLRPDLSRGAELKEAGLTMGLHPKTKEKDTWLRYGALKGYIDGIMGTHGALFFEPYDDQPDNYGHWRRHTSDDPESKTRNMEKMYNLIKVGVEGGFVPNVHAIGTRGVAEMLDLYERLHSESVDLTGFRVIHAQVIRPQDFPRFNALGVIAEVNPYHISDDMRWMEERIGHERCKGAYAFKSLLDNGAMLSFGSDWPGTSVALYHMHPKYLIYAAVARKTLKGTPEKGWFPEQKISVEESIKAFTINNAIAAFEGDIRGSIEVGKLADLTVFDKNLIEIPEADILKTEVTYTIVDGKVVFER
ncbi:MAG: amidohydrolase family protein [Candidatus Aminicenantes bacterium]|nr:amidohydrolase family protein [Candidatus Aminicenantes bacterium]